MNEVHNLPFWRFLGLAVKAGRVVTGSEAIELKIKREKGYLVIIAEDAALGSVEKIQKFAVKAELPMVFAGNKKTIGHWTGKVERVAALVTDKGFADRLIELINDTTESKSNS